MTIPPNSQLYESYVPVYDVVPEKWEDAREFLIEQLKKISNGTNIREIGWLLDEELLSGKQLFPGVSNPLQFRSVLRKVVDTGALAAGANPGIAHNILFDANFTLIDLWVAGTNSGTLTARVISGNDVLMDAINITITSPQIFDRSLTVFEYVQER